MFKAKHIMNTQVVTVRRDEATDHAISLMVEHEISGLPVVDAAGKLVGVISEADLLGLVFDCFGEQNQVGQYMSTEPCQVDAEDAWTDVADLFRTKPIRLMPVTHQGKLVGVISGHDLLRTVRDSRKLVADVLAQQKPPRQD